VRATVSGPNNRLPTYVKRHGGRIASGRGVTGDISSQKIRWNVQRKTGRRRASAIAV